MDVPIDWIDSVDAAPRAHPTGLTVLLEETSEPRWTPDRLLLAGLLALLFVHAIVKEKLEDERGDRSVPAYLLANPGMAEALAKSVRAHLSPDQAARYQKEIDERAAAHKQAVVLNLVVMVDRALVLTSEQRVRNMLDLGATVLLCTPTYALRLADVAREIGVNVSAASIRTTIHAGEPGASIPATRAAIEAAYSAVSFDHTGMTELGPTGYSCSARDGVHLIESEFIFEVADDGELIATNLGRWGMPLFRYRTLRSRASRARAVRRS